MMPLELFIEQQAWLAVRTMQANVCAGVTLTRILFWYAHHARVDYDRLVWEVFTLAKQIELGETQPIIPVKD